MLALMLLSGLVACESENAEVCKGKAGVFWYQESDVYLGMVREALNRELDKANVEYTNYFAEGNQSKQIDQIKTAIADGATLLIVNQVTSGSLETAENIMMIAGDIPVIFFNRPIGSEANPDPAFYEQYENACFIGTDAPEAGHMQGKMIGTYVLSHFESLDLNGDGYISYAMLKGDEENVEAIFRTQYSVSDANRILAASGRPSLRYFDSSKTKRERYQVDPNGAWSAEAAKAFMDRNLIFCSEKKNNMIELVICNNDDMAEGAVAALQEKGYNIENSRYIPVFGVDATATAQALIANQSMTGTVKQDSQGMALAIRQTAEGILSGFTPGEALDRLVDSRFSRADDSGSKLYIAYTPYMEEE